MIDFFEIDELVNVPKHKMIGKVYDKVILNGSFFLYIKKDFKRTQDTYGTVSERTHYKVEYDFVKSLLPWKMYNKNNKILKLFNILSTNDIKHNQRVKFIDNYYIENLFNDDKLSNTNLLYTKFYISLLKNAKKITIYKPKKIRPITYSNAYFIYCKVKYDDLHENFTYIDIRGLQKYEKESIIKRLRSKINFIYKFFKFISNGNV